jgi:hypothetical protein
MRWAMTSGRPIRVGRAMFFVDDDLGGAQHAFVLALGVGNALVLGALGHAEDRLHGVPEAYTKLCSFSP